MIPKKLENAIEVYKKRYATPILTAISHYIKSDGVADESIFIRLNFLTNAERLLIKTFHHHYDYLINELDEATQRKKLSSQKFVNKLVILGHTLLNGIGVDEDVAKAYACFKLAAEANHPIAYNDIGWMHKNGVYLPRNAALAIQYYDQGRQAKSLIAESNWAHSVNLENDERTHILQTNPFEYLNLGDHQKKLGNLQAALDYYRKALKQHGNVQALVSIGKLYFYHPELLPNRYELAVACYELGATRYGKSAFELGWLYEHGLGVQKDLARSETLYLFAAERGYTPALYYLGAIYKYKIKAPDKSAFYYRLTIEQDVGFAPSALVALRECMWPNATPVQKYHAFRVMKGVLDPLLIVSERAKLEEMLFTCNQENKSTLEKAIEVFPRCIREHFAIKLHLLKIAMLRTHRNDSVGILPLRVFLHIFKYVMGDQIMSQFLNKKLFASTNPEYEDWQTEYRASVVVRRLAQRAVETYGGYWFKSKTGVTLFGHQKKTFTIIQSEVQEAQQGTRSYAELLKNIRHTLK